MFQVEKANPGQDPYRQVACVGSVKKKNFSGWAELVDGRKPLRNRIVGLNAREGSIERQASKGNRLMEGVEYEKPSNYTEIPGGARINAMLSILSRNPDYTAAGKGRFIITGGNWTPGLYTWSNKKTQAAYFSRSKKKKIIRDNRDTQTKRYPGVRRVQTFGKAPKSQRYNWPQLTTTRLMAWYPADVRWANYFGPIIDRAKH
jgi:hypothetical protein